MLSPERPDPSTWWEWNVSRSRAQSLGLETSVDAAYGAECPDRTQD